MLMNLQGFAVIPRHLWHDPDVPAHAKLVYVTLTSFAGPTGTSWPSQATIAATCGLSVSSVQRALKWLEANGHVSWDHRFRGDGTKSSNGYTVHIRSVPVTDTPGQADRSLTRPIERKEELPKNDAVELTTDSDSPGPSSSHPRSWEPSASAKERVMTQAQVLDVELHIDRYIVRCRERSTKPSNTEWVRWFLDDEQKARTEQRLLRQQGGPLVDDTGTPTSWKGKMR